jgi:hypothetical protein
MAQSVEDVDPEVLNLLKLNRERRTMMKLKILASLRVLPKSEEPPTTSRVRRMTSEMVFLGIKDVGINLEVDVSGLDSHDGLKLRFMHHLAKHREDCGVKERQHEEIVKMKEVHDHSRNELKTQIETIKLVRLKNRRLRRVLQVLQLRLVASTLALQFQMQRKIELTQRLENLNYYRDTILENAFAFFYGQLPHESSIPLGGVFSPYAYIDYNDEEERVEREFAYLTSLTPTNFKSSAQQRRVSFRTVINESIPQYSPFATNGKPSSIEYSSLAKLSSFSQSAMGDSPLSERRGSEDSHNFASGVVSSSVMDSSTHTKRLALGKGLKPSMSDRPTRHEAGGSPSKKSPGLFSIFKNK